MCRGNEENVPDIPSPSATGYLGERFNKSWKLLRKGIGKGEQIKRENLDYHAS